MALTSDTFFLNYQQSIVSFPTVFVAVDPLPLATKGFAAKPSLIWRRGSQNTHGQFPRARWWLSKSETARIPFLADCPVVIQIPFSFLKSPLGKTFVEMLLHQQVSVEHLLQHHRRWNYYSSGREQRYVSPRRAPSFLQ